MCVIDLYLYLEHPSPRSSILLHRSRKIFVQCDGTIGPIPQVGDGTFHYAKVFAKLKDRLLGKEGWDVTISSFRARYNNLIANKSEEWLERDEGYGGMLAVNIFKQLNYLVEDVYTDYQGGFVTSYFVPQ